MSSEHGSGPIKKITKQGNAQQIAWSQALRMASLAAACRATARLTSSSRAAATRNLSTTTRALAAHNFTMPALSPTMTEGNIASWNVKEGDTFSAGDVLLEIETDKATMDVEAQDDGIMMKIMSQSGSKAVQVGSRIAVVAESGDDISSLEIPADESPKQQQSSSSSSSAPEEQEVKRDEENREPQRVAKDGEAHVVRYPLLPSVGHLAKQKGLGDEDLSKIKPTGPGGRLLKGDVLAYIGSIGSESPATQSSRFDKLAHLDLSNIKVAEKKAPSAAPKEDKVAPQAPVIESLELRIPVSLAKVVEVQNKINDTLGVFLPLSTFINRVADMANDELPAAKRTPTADELFDQVLGLDKVKAAKGSRGIYLPQISAIPPPSAFPPAAARPAKKADIFDVLSSKATKRASPSSIAAVPGVSSGANVFSLVVPKTEEKRAQLFLERCKLILESEPGRLVL
ncbi:Pyruvate dehydrogenase complex protein X component-like protein [Emericellopsis cladophorae]|uniref:Pyruvate dehydrogenase complex protein X component-like protein n=1 Tax=Emericellopsis cladophorae TaxID=2686198 RepID=A0A9P9Y5R4_9HYPO|nr:Pyruvate dehydrogenase complex protein X component-like protein [Emericellopsis cladophorae]KAI6783850.1 Pyruvate dehydrogenase complex protein X component-like protein [Emericellopsis cladophorae]